MWELDCEEGWALKNWCFWTMVLEKTFESSLDCKKIQPIHPKGNWSGLVIRRTDAEAEILLIWPLDAKNWLIWKDPDGGKDWRQEEKGTTEDEMVGWHHRLDKNEFEQVRSWWLTGEPGMLQIMGSQRVRHNRATELNWGFCLVSGSGDYSLWCTDFSLWWLLLFLSLCARALMLQ